MRYICARLPEGAIHCIGEGSSTFLPDESVKTNTSVSLSDAGAFLRQAGIVPNKTNSKRAKPKQAVNFFIITSKK
jgi:hypothetical protein